MRSLVTDNYHSTNYHYLLKNILITSYSCFFLKNNRWPILNRILILNDDNKFLDDILEGTPLRTLHHNS